MAGGAAHAFVIGLQVLRIFLRKDRPGGVQVDGMMGVGILAVIRLDPVVARGREKDIALDQLLLQFGLRDDPVPFVPEVLSVGEIS